MKRTWILIGMAMLLLTSYQIATTYAKYTTEATGTVEKYAGAWVINVNNTNISNGSQQNSFTISQLTYPAAQNVAPNKMAPSSTGYFEITINPTGSSVAVRYDITLDIQNFNILDSIKFNSVCKVVNGQEVSQGIVQTGTNTYSGIISLNDVKNSVPTTLRFYLEWENKGTDAGDEEDSALGLVKNTTVGLPVTVVVSQYSGETLE